MKAVVAAFNQEKALVGAFSVITNLRMELFEVLVTAVSTEGSGGRQGGNLMFYYFTVTPRHHITHRTDGALTTLSSNTVTQPRENSG